MVMPTKDVKMLMPSTAASLHRAFRKPKAVVLLRAPAWGEPGARAGKRGWQEHEGEEDGRQHPRGRGKDAREYGQIERQGRKQKTRSLVHSGKSGDQSRSC